MAGKRDSLLFALGRSRLTGSAKTTYNHKKEAAGFVKYLRSLGFWVQEWSNVTNKHVAAVVAQWKSEGLSTATIKSYMAGVRAVCLAYGNDRIHEDNDAFGIERRVYISNQDKSVSDEAYREAVRALEQGDDKNRRVGLMLRLQREFGLRLEESIKLNPFRDAEGSLLHVHVGTKGGRPRWVPIRTETQRALLEDAKTSGFYPSIRSGLIPKGIKEKTWRGTVYRAVRAQGFTKGAVGTMHGLRHAYCHARYEELTGFKCPVKFTAAEAYKAQALERAGPDWRNADEKARCTLREELGHGVGREDIDSQYLGRW